MKERLKAPVLVLAYGAVVTFMAVVPNDFIAFMVGVVAGGMIALNLGEQLRKDRERRHPHGNG